MRVEIATLPTVAQNDSKEEGGFDESNPYRKTGNDPLFHGYTINIMVR